MDGDELAGQVAVGQPDDQAAVGRQLLAGDGGDHTGAGRRRPTCRWRSSSALALTYPRWQRSRSRPGVLAGRRLLSQQLQSYLTFSASICPSGTGVCDPAVPARARPERPAGGAHRPVRRHLLAGQGPDYGAGAGGSDRPDAGHHRHHRQTGTDRTTPGELQTSGPGNQQRRRAAHPEAHPLAEHQP